MRAPAGASAWWESLADRRRWSRFALALALGALAWLADNRFPPAAPVATDLSVATSFVAGLLFGGPGAAGVALAEGVGDLALSGVSPAAALTAAAGSFLAGFAPFLIFRHVRGLGRGLPDLRSYFWFFSAAVLAGLLPAFAGGVLTAPGSPLVSARHLWVRCAADIVSILIFAPPAVLWADRFFRRRMLAIRGEMPASRSFRLLHRSLDDRLIGAEETVLIRRRGERFGWEALSIAVAIVLVSAAVVPLSALFPLSGGWVVLLYLIPVLWSAYVAGLRGGVLAASASGGVFLVGRGLLDLGGGEPVLREVGVLASYAELVIFSVIGAVLGASRTKEVGLHNELAEHNRLLRRDLLRVVQALTGAVEAKDLYTEAHLRRVSEYAVAVGERLGLRGGELEALFFGSMLHDIGKIGIPEEVLRKQGPLTPEEEVIMQRHPEIGARIVANLDVLGDAAPLILHHQERYDGSTNGAFPGYPHGLVGDEIPLGARIIAVVDAFDAMTTDRPYRKALRPAEALEELCKERGGQFDPAVVDAFAEILGEGF